MPKTILPLPVRRTLERWYAHRLRASVRTGVVPRHVALTIDGNRRWAREMGYADAKIGHRYGAAHVHTVLGWCAAIGVTHVTVWICSVDNLRKRASAEVDNLMRMIETVITAPLIEPDSHWRVHTAGQLDGLPDSTRFALKQAVEITADRPDRFHVTFAIGYDGRAEIVDAVRAVLEKARTAGTPLADVADRITDADIAAHLYIQDQPEPDLVIRTSGERRSSGFLLWQAADADLYFADVYWPGFREIDFLRAVRAYRRRRQDRLTSAEIVN
jgi:short-chain Z-isoprenyl diphosphate synthase